MRIAPILLASVLCAALTHAQDERAARQDNPGTLPQQTASGSGGRAYVRASPDGRTWTIGNGLVERVVRYDPAIGLHTASWVHKPTGTDFVKHAREGKRWGPEFSFVADGQRFAGAGEGPSAAFELQGGEPQETSPLGMELRLRLQAKARPLVVVVHYAVYDGHPVVRKWIDILNAGSSPITLSHLVFEAVNIAPGLPNDLQVSAFYGTQPREIFYTGRVDDPAIAVRDARSGEGFIVMNEAPGYLKRTEIADSWSEGLEVMYDTDLFPFERRIEPKETFTSAKSSVAFFVEGQGMADPRWLMPSYTSQILMKKGAAYQPPWIYNTWEPFERGINSNIVRDLVSVAGRMGLDVFTIDDGWQTDYGENTVNTKAFPHGLEEVGRLAGQNNLRLGLWVPLAAISPNTAVYREHPEWLCKDMNGRPKFTGTAAGSQAVMCLATPYREVAAKRISELIGRYHLKYVKIDLTTVFNAYGEAPGCYAQGHAHKTWAESLERIYEGIQYVTDRIYRDHPDVLLDLTFELWGQKHVIDYGLLAAGDLDWLSNVDDGSPEAAGPRQARTLLYLRSLAIPAETMLIGNLHADTPAIEERLATAMGSGPLFLGDLGKLTPAEQDWYGERIRWFKKLRAAVPINEGFFPLGAWAQPGAATWDGFARLSRQGEGLIAIFKNESGTQNVEVKLPVFPEGSFRVRSVMTGESLATFSGEQIRRGIQVRLPANYKVEILEVRR
jgi:alpha-galactosidase